MRPSRFNAFVPRRGEYVLYNTRSEQWAVVDAEMKETLESGALDDLPGEVLSLMKSKEFIVEDDVDELRIFRTERKFAHCSTFGHSIELNLMMTYACNLACPYCDQVLAKHHHESMSRKTADIILKFIEKETTKERYTRQADLLFYGGEPLLNWPCCQYILDNLEAHSPLSNTIRFITNGTLFNDQIIESLTQYDIYKIDVTFDGAKPDHDRRRVTHDGRGTYDVIMKNLTHMADAGLPCAIKVNVDKENHIRIEQLFEDIQNNGLGEVPIGINPVSHPKVAPTAGPDYCMKREDLTPIIPEVWRLAKKWGILIDTKPIKTAAICMSSHFSVFLIDPLLDVYKCSEFVGITDHIVGKITEDGSFQPTDLFYYSITRDPTYLEKCSACNLLPVCGESCCVALSYGVYKDYYETFCNRVKTLFEENVNWFLDLLEIDSKKPSHNPQEV